MSSAKRIRDASSLWVLLAIEKEWIENYAQPEPDGTSTLVRTQTVDVEPIAWCLSRDEAERVAKDIRNNPGRYSRAQWSKGATVVVRECPPPFGLSPQVISEWCEAAASTFADRAATLERELKEGAA